MPDRPAVEKRIPSMTTSHSPKQQTRPSLPMIAATTAALPAVMLSSLALAEPAAAEMPTRALPATLAAAMKAQAAQAATPVIPAASVSTTIPSALQPARPSAPASYTIARGDTISAVARRFALNTSEILRLNGLRASTIIYPGQKIKLSGKAAAAPAARKAPAAQAARPAAVSGSTYTVKAGDTLGAIAARHGVRLADVFSWNNLSGRSLIYPGQKIKIGTAKAAPARAAAPAPAPAKASSAKTAGGSYTVRSGDTLSGIASRHGVKLSALLSANRLSMQSIIYPGNKLAIPGGAPTAALQPAAATKPLVPSSFLGFTYPPAVVNSANANKARLNASPVPTPEQMRNIVAETARRMGVEPSLALAFAYQESGFNQRAVSPANAIGTMQVIPSSGEWASDLVGRKLNLLNPQDNVTAGVAIIRQLLATSKTKDLAIAGYYQGQYSVSKYGMYRDTKAYVAAIKAHQKNFS